MLQESTYHFSKDYSFVFCDFAFLTKTTLGVDEVGRESEGEEAGEPENKNVIACLSAPLS